MGEEGGEAGGNDPAVNRNPDSNVNECNNGLAPEKQWKLNQLTSNR